MKTALYQWFLVPMLIIREFGLIPFLAAQFFVSSMVLFLVGFSVIFFIIFITTLLLMVSYFIHQKICPNVLDELLGKDHV